LLNAPQPRSRLYTTAKAYAKALTGVVGGLDDGKGSEITRFERALEQRFAGCRAVAVPMARVGIYLALKNSIRRGQKVVMSPYTISDVVNMVLCAGGVPLFADIEPGATYNIDPDEVARLVMSENDIGAVLVTHFYGLVCDLNPILAICRKKGIPVIEDAAQAFGAELEGRPAGTLADAGVFSFGLLKNITGFLGGAVITRDAGLADKIRADLREFATMSRQTLMKKVMSGAMFDLATFMPLFDTSVYWLFRYAYLHDLDFFNNKLDTDSNPVAYGDFPPRYSYRMSGVQADIICDQFDRVSAQAVVRIANAKRYHDGLADIPGIALPPMRTDRSHIYLYYTVQCEDRDAVAKTMTRKLRDVQISHHRNCAALPCFAKFAADCPNAARAERCALYLPTYPGYRAEQIDANIASIRAYFREGNAWT
jgi:perosamine synthetase